MKNAIAGSYSSTIRATKSICTTAAYAGQRPGLAAPYADNGQKGASGPAVSDTSLDTESMRKIERWHSARLRACASQEGVAAYLANEDAEVYNVTDAAVSP